MTQSKLKTGCKYCLYNLPPRCGLSTADIAITPTMPYHIQTDISSELAFMTNLPLLQQFFENETLNMIKDETLLNNSTNIKLRPLKWYKQQTDTLLAVDHETSMSLYKLVDLAKRDQTLYSHYESPIIEGKIESDTTWLITKVFFPILAIITTITHTMQSGRQIRNLSIHFAQRTNIVHSPLQ